MPVRGFFPYASVEDSAAAVIWGARQFALVVVHVFVDSQDAISFPLPEGEWDPAAPFNPPPELSISGGTLHLRPTTAFSGHVILLERQS